MFCKILLLTISFLSFLSWDCWYWLFISELLLVVLLLNHNTWSSLFLLFFQSPWLIFSLSCYVTSISSLLLFWHNTLSFVLNNWCYLFRLTSSLEFFLTFEFSLLMMSTSFYWFSLNNTQLHWAFWGMFLKFLSLNSFTDILLVFLLSTGGLALYLIYICPYNILLTLVWLLFPLYAFVCQYIWEEYIWFDNSCFLWVFLCGFNFSILVAQEYIFLLLLGHFCIWCVLPWLLILVFILIYQISSLFSICFSCYQISNLFIFVTFVVLLLLIVPVMGFFYFWWIHALLLFLSE